MNYEPFTSIENPTLAHFIRRGGFSSLYFTLAHFRHLRHFRHFIFLYICRELSTNQLLFMQNKPNFQKSQMNVNPYNTMDYGNKWPWRVRKNKPNSNPNKPNLRKAKMNVSLYILKNYRKKDDFEVRINKPNCRKGKKLMQSVYLQRIMKNNADMGSKKTNPIQTQFQMAIT